MTLVRKDDGEATVRLISCPFCGECLEGKRPPMHLMDCVEFYSQNGVEVPTRLRLEQVADLEHAEEAADG